MPKIIENVREQLLTEARKQIAERGYAETTVRSVAGACGLGVGTVYNYFKSKEMLIATFMFEDWERYLNEMRALPTEEPRVLLGGIYASLRAFEDEYENLFFDADAVERISVGRSKRHSMLRSQIAAFVAPLCEHPERGAFLSEFIAEALIRWSMEKAPFENVYAALEKIIK